MEDEKFVLGIIFHAWNVPPSELLSIVPIDFFTVPLYQKIYRIYLRKGEINVEDVYHLDPAAVELVVELIGGQPKPWDFWKERLREYVRGVYAKRITDKLQRALNENLPPEQLLAALRKSCMDMELLVDGVTRNVESLHVKELVNQYVEYSKTRKIYSVPYSRLNDYVGGISGGDYWIIGARPSVGKTAFAINMCYQMARNKIPVYFMSLEMSRYSVAERILSLVHRKEISEIRRMVNWDTWHNPDYLAQKLDIPFYIMDSNSFTEQTIHLVYEDSLKYSTKVVVLDYLQFIRSKSAKPRHEVMAEISSTIKDVSKRYDVSTIALSQLNRLSESRADKRPQLAELRDSGALEQDADVVMLLHRPNPEENVLEINIVKNRQGPQGKFNLLFDTKHQVITDDLFEIGQSVYEVQF
jgi:replicative DNA helicase